MIFFSSKNIPDKVKIVHQGIDTLVSSHISTNLEDYVKKFQPNLYLLEELKEKAQDKISFSQADRFIHHSFYLLGKSKVYAQGQGRYTYKIENENVLIFIGTHKYGANEFQTPQIKVEFRSSFLFQAGHKKAYEYVLNFLNNFIGETRNLCSRIDLATDIQGIKYTSFDKYRFQTNYKRAEFSQVNEYLKFHKTTGFHIGKGDFLFRIYDKKLEIKNSASKGFIEYRWITNGYKPSEELPVWRHEVQYRRAELNKYMPKNLEDEVLFQFTQLDKLWHNATQKVRWTDLSNDEIVRISENSLKPDSIRKIYQRARQNPDRIDFWNILKNWSNQLARQIDKFNSINAPKLKTALRLFKGFLGATYKALGNDPKNFAEIFQMLHEDLRLQGLNMQQFAELKVLGSFVQNAKNIEKYGLQIDFNYDEVAYQYFNKLQNQLTNIDEYKELNNAKHYFEHTGVLNAS